MAVRYKALILDTYVANAAGALYTGGTGEETAVHVCTLTNISGGAATVTLHLYSSGGSASNSNAIIKDKSLASNETYVVPSMTNMVIPAGAVFAGVASAASTINIAMAGVVKT